jgi:hypothetical protein
MNRILNRFRQVEQEDEYAHPETTGRTNVSPYLVVLSPLVTCAKCGPKTALEEIALSATGKRSVGPSYQRRRRGGIGGGASPHRLLADNLSSSSSHRATPLWASFNVTCAIS